MKAQRTPWWYYPIAALIGLLFGVAAMQMAEKTSVSLVGAPWLIAVVLGLLGLVTLYLAWQVHRYLTDEPERRKSWYDPKKAVFTLVLAKALALAGAVLAGWYFGQTLMALPHIEASYYRTIVVQCGVTGLVCLADMVIGIVSEGMCQIPPSDGPEHPRTKARKRRVAPVASLAEQQHR